MLGNLKTGSDSPVTAGWPQEVHLFQSQVSEVPVLSTLSGRAHVKVLSNWITCMENSCCLEQSSIEVLVKTHFLLELQNLLHGTSPCMSLPELAWAPVFKFR